MKQSFRKGFLLIIGVVFAIGQAGAQDFGQSKKFRKLTEPVILGAGKVEKRQMDVDGVSRMYFLYTPKNAIAGKQLPLVLCFHGGGGTPHGQDRIAGGITRTADKNGFLVAFPEGLDKHWNDGRKDLVKRNYDDVSFISKLIDQLKSEGKIDAERVYATGISNGGFFSQYLAIKLPGRIAAVASVAASVPTHFAQESVPVTPVMLMLGTKDTLVLWNGGRIGGNILRKGRGEVFTARQSLEFWLGKNDNKGQAQKTDLSQNNAERIRDKGNMVAYMEDFNAVDRAKEVVFVGIEGGGHTWPSGQQYLPAFLVGPVCRDFDANQLIWDFFSRHQLSEKLAYLTYPTTAGH